MTICSQLDPVRLPETYYSRAVTLLTAPLGAGGPARPPAHQEPPARSLEYYSGQFSINQSTRFKSLSSVAKSLHARHASARTARHPLAALGFHLDWISWVFSLVIFMIASLPGKGVVDAELRSRAGRPRIKVVAIDPVSTLEHDAQRLNVGQDNTHAHSLGVLSCPGRDCPKLNPTIKIQTSCAMQNSMREYPATRILGIPRDYKPFHPLGAL